MSQPFPTRRESRHQVAVFVGFQREAFAVSCPVPQKRGLGLLFNALDRAFSAQCGGELRVPQRFEKPRNSKCGLRCVLVVSAGSRLPRGAVERKGRTRQSRRYTAASARGARYVCCGGELAREELLSSSRAAPLARLR